MKPITTPDTNHCFGEAQDEYNSYPGHMDLDSVFTGTWSLTWAERLQILFAGKLYVSHYTFWGKLQPFAMTTKKPELSFASSEQIQDAATVSEQDQI